MNRFISNSHAATKRFSYTHVTLYFHTGSADGCLLFECRSIPINFFMSASTGLSGLTHLDFYPPLLLRSEEAGYISFSLAEALSWGQPEAKMPGTKSVRIRN
jgi:hypothetical protein